MKKKEDDLSTQFLMTALPNVDDVKSPFKDYETNKYEKDQINYADDYYNYKDNKYHYSDDYYYKNQDNADDIITTPISIC